MCGFLQTSPQRSFYLDDRFISASQGNTLIPKSKFSSSLACLPLPSLALECKNSSSSTRTAVCCDVHSRGLQLLLFRTLANLLVRQQSYHWVVFLGQDECILEHARLRSSEGSKVATEFKLRSKKVNDVLWSFI